MSTPDNFDRNVTIQENPEYYGTDRPHPYLAYTACSHSQDTVTTGYNGVNTKYSTAWTIKMRSTEELSKRNESISKAHHVSAYKARRREYYANRECVKPDCSDRCRLYWRCIKVTTNKLLKAKKPEQLLF